MEKANEVGTNMVQNIVRIAKILENSKLNNRELDEIYIPNRNLADYLGTTKEQAVVFAIAFALQSKINTVEIKDIVGFLGMSYLDAITIKSDIDKLIQVGLFETEDEQFKKRARKSPVSRIYFTIPTVISEQVYANQPIQIKGKQPLDIYGFSKLVGELIQKRKYEALTTRELFSMVKNLEEDNSNLTPVSQLKALVEIEDRTLLYEIMNDHITFGVPFSIMESTLSDIYDSPRERRKRVSQIMDRTNTLINLEFIDFEHGTMANDVNLLLSDSVLELFLQEDAHLFMSSKKNKALILNEDIVSKELFYAQDLQKDIDFLTQSLTNNMFTELQDKLSDMGLIKGIAAIFYGEPGTGKTESVYQIAKKTGRDIFKVDISQTKSMWLGESEKQIKKVFQNYEKACKQCKLKPILLFNEADAILSKRQENGFSNVSQTENAIQNILLEELEKFEGILIATTNLQGNLDSAFERRFLFKICFEKPSIEIKTKIWRSKLNGIDESQAMNLSREYSFSGGEIDNIVRKVTMEEVLTGKTPDASEIHSFCEKEQMLSVNKNRIRIGFA